MREQKKTFLSLAAVFLIQIAMLLFCMAELSTEYVNQPLLYLYGRARGTTGFKILYFDMWALNGILYCAVVLKKKTLYAKENFYMILPRHGSYRSYYKIVCTNFIVDTVLFQAALALGALCGVGLYRFLPYEIAFNARFFVWSQLCMLAGNLFLGSIAMYCIFRFYSFQAAIIVYPGIPIIAFIAGSALPVKISAFLPGSHLLLARSSLMAEGGFLIAPTLLIELLLCAVMIWQCFLVREKLVE